MGSMLDAAGFPPTIINLRQYKNTRLCSGRPVFNLPLQPQVSLLHKSTLYRLTVTINAIKEMFLHQFGKFSEGIVCSSVSTLQC